MEIKYRIGIMPGPWPAGPEGTGFLWELVDLCERTGIDSIWLSDRLSSPARDPRPEVMTTLAAIAARTSRLKFGPSVLVLPYRTPVVAAKEMATIDYLSEGRLLPAVGVGVEIPKEFEASGVPFKERGRRTDEAIQFIRRLWLEDEVTFHGEFYRLERITILPKPAQKPPPIWIGGNSEAAMRRAGRLGDGWIPSFIPPEAFARGVGRVQHHAGEAGREVPADHFGALINYTLADSSAAAAKLADPYLPRNRVDEATLARSTAFGPAEVVAGKIEEYVAGGGSKFILRPLCPPELMLEQLQRLAEEVIPAFHR
ncbi:MAG: TIGR03619 family F420-dependent LLM class oxidoreductase [Candidatus Rokubacteria bacterium]|nr:TIGR03619 family F420-dependent LLM class oxidoreductase [Candidatus Rokubacteria bacterium]